MIMEGDATAASFKADYAASDRSKCAWCRQGIPQHELRVGPLVQSAKGDFLYPQWHHFGCFERGYLKKHAGTLISTSAIAGLDSLRFEDQKKLKSLVVAGDSQIETKALTDDEKRLAADNKLLWTRREKLEALSNRELQELLECNNQPFVGKLFGGRLNMLDRAADAMAFGVLPKCSLCKSGDLTFVRGAYSCTGAMDEFTKCINTVHHVERTALKIPPALEQAHDFLSRRTFKPRARCAVAVEATSAIATAAPEGDAKVGEKRQRPATEHDAMPPSGAALKPFAGHAVLLVGKLSRTQRELQKLIVEHGGTIAGAPPSASICVCTSLEAAGKGTQKGRDALSRGVQCVSEGWIDASIKAQSRLSPQQYAPFVLASASTASDAKVAREEKQVMLGAKLAVEQEAARQLQLLEERFTDKPLLKSGQQQQQTKKLIVKGDAAVEPSSGLAECGSIHRAGGRTYATAMSLTDVTTGKNSFYILQLISHDDQKKWSVYRKWGRLGDDSIGGDKLTSFPLLGPAIREFNKVFLDKTGNDFEAGKFQKIYGKFQPVEIDFGAAALPPSLPSGGGGGGGGVATQSGYGGPLDQQTQGLMQLIFDIKAMCATLEHLEIDVTKLPLGSLSKKTIQEGFVALSALERLIQAPSFDPSDPMAKMQLASQTNRFYTFIPHVVPPSGGALPLLSSLDMVKEKVKLLTSLQDLEVASKLVVRSHSGAAEGNGPHPIDEHYARLKTDLRSVPRESREFVQVNEYLQNTHAATHHMYTLELVDLWSVDRHGEAARFAPWSKDPNRMLLWHGSRITNWSGILSQGLRIAPPEAPSTGYMFGKGVYFANMSSKSANYCYTSSSSTTGVLMLAEVALGDMMELKRAKFVEKLPPPFKSTKGVGKNCPDPAGNITDQDGCVIPAGKGAPSGVHDTSLLYDEFVVYDVSQVRMRYLLRVEFHYKVKMGTFF